jgi:hypothetical protein
MAAMDGPLIEDTSLSQNYKRNTWKDKRKWTQQNRWVSLLDVHVRLIKRA